MGPWWWPLLWCLHVALVHGTGLVGGQLRQDGPPRPAGWSPAPSSSWAPTSEPGASRDPEGSAAALAFLQTGDAQQLARANCSRGVAAGAPGPGPPPTLRATLRAAPEALAQAANFLNMLFQTNDIREASVAEDVEWYQALVRSLAEGHPWVRRAVLALDAHPLAAKPRLMLQATKGDGEILLRDVSSTAPGLSNLSWDNEWFNALKLQRTLPLRKRVLSNDLRSMETPKWQRGDSYVGEAGHVRWSPPFLECRDGRFLPAWAVTLSSAFYGLKPDLSPEFKGVVRVDVELRDVAIDQCASGPGWFADTHHCDLNSTQCVPQESRGFVLGRYLCRCKPGFYGAGGVASGARAGAAAGADGRSRLACRPCRQGCAACEDDAPCLIQEDRALRAAVLSCQACCMLAVFLSMLVSYHFRRSKRIRASGVVLLETILFGSLLLYFPVFILYFKPSIFRCIVLRWVRMLGFAIVYGTITLKLYRVLKVFLSRTAQRAPYVSSGRVLKMLGLILLLVLWFLAAWTIGMLENIDRNIPLVIRTQTARGLHFYICGHDHWDYMMVIAEMLFLLWGSFLCYATRAVPSAFHEPRYMGIALHNELMMSAAFHVVRFVMVPSLHPDWTLLLFFAHTHGTITMTLALLFIPKFLHAGSPLREEIAAEVYEDELDLRRSGSCLNSSIASAWSEHSLDPDDIREELKKLYTQLEVHETRRMAANNPHLPKKRSSRRSLGRSIVRHVAELPEALGRWSGGSERVGTPARHGSSAKRLPDAGGASLRMRDEGSRRRAAATRRSRSSKGPARERRGGSPSEPTSETMAATASEQSDSESLDAAPLVCKSASAHNLAGHARPPLPRAAPLQKSLSVIAGAREEALLAARRAAREEWHASRHLSAPSSAQGPPREAGRPPSPGAADDLPPAGSSPAEGCSQEDTSLLADAKAQKHVTYAPVKSVSIDGSHFPGRVRVAVRRTPPPPPVRYQSLGQRAAPAGASLGPAEPPADPPVWAGQPTGTPEGAAEEEPGPTSPPAEKGRGLPAASIPAQVCPWELIQEEILSRKQKATEAADAGTGGDAAAAPLSLQPPSQKTSLRGLGLAIKALNRARGKSGLRGSREGEGSLRKKGRERDGASRRDRPSLAETSAMSLGGLGRDPAAKSPAWSRQRPGSEPTARPWPGEVDPYQHNNNASAAWEAVGWGDSGAVGQRGGPAPGTGDGEKLAEQPSAPQRDADAGGGPEIPSGVHEIPPGAGHQERDERPCESALVGGSGKAPVRPRPGAEGPVAQPGQGAPVAAVRPSAPKEEVAGPSEGCEGGSGSIRPRDRAEVEQPRAKPMAGSPDLSAAGARGAAVGERGAEVCPQGPPGVPAGRGALLRQGAIASREDSTVPSDRESPAEALEKGGTQPEPLAAGGGRGTGVSPAAPGKAGSAAGGQEKRRRLGEGVGSIRPKSLRLRSAQESGSSLQAPSQPWGSAGSEGPPPKSAPKSSEPPEATVRSPASARGAVCPWEAAGAAGGAEVCPWERGTAASDTGKLDDGDTSHEKNGISPRREAPRGTAETAPVAEKGSGQGGSPGPGKGVEEPDPGLAGKHPALPKTAPEQAGAIGRRKGDICPWEREDEPRAKTEICPWEEPAAALGKERRSQDKREASKGENKPGSGVIEEIKAKLAVMGARPERRDSRTFAKLPRKSQESSKAESKKSQSVDSIKEEVCPWESLGTEQPPEKPRTRSPAISKSPSAVPQSVESLKAEVCPWESLGTELPPEKPHTRSPALPKYPSKKSQSVESLKAEVCPWESLAMEQTPEKPRTRSPALPKLPSKKSQSVESLKAEVCPWEAPEVKPIDKAEICPWEVAAPLPGKGAAPGQANLPPKKTGASKSQEKGSREREAICPWESLGTEQPPGKPHAESPVIPKSPSEKSQSVGSLKAEVCPWESLAMEQPPEKPRARSPAIPKSPSSTSQSVESLKAEVCPWEALEGEAAGRAEICPWEAAAPPCDRPKATLGPGGDSRGDKRITRQAALASPVRSLEKGSSEREAVCPWESLGMEQPPGKPRAGSPALPKSPSEKSQSVESLKAEVCPWEALEGEAAGRAEICPWEAAAPPCDRPKATLGPGGDSRGDKRIMRQAALASPVRSLEKGRSRVH
ncbi:putative G-protein coupled receptor 179 [Chlamydotis macqueenii]